MVELKTLYSCRRYLLEQIGTAADEIKQIDESLAIASRRPPKKVGNAFYELDLEAPAS